jgi:hypothetical protein
MNQTILWSFKKSPAVTITLNISSGELEAEVPPFPVGVNPLRLIGPLLATIIFRV